MIKVKNLSRNFGDILAVKDVSFEVEKGEVLGFLGPNGAGKTTTMRIITGYIEPTFGSVEVGGFDVQQDSRKVKSLIGYLPENAPLYRDMDVAGFLKFVAEIRGLKGTAAKEAISKVVEICHLNSVFYQSIDTLSKGYVRRTVLAQAIIHDPPVLILDEPTDGLDPNQKHEVRNMISQMGKDKAIIISTHILEEVDACCSRAIIIANGSLVANGTPSELKKMSSNAGTILLDITGAKFANIRDS
ncbi:MAG: ATP-binding cassette domain-containing protein, partial [Candidatus Nanoarchaeia archaeon]